MLIHISYYMNIDLGSYIATINKPLGISRACDTTTRELSAMGPVGLGHGGLDFIVGDALASLTKKE